jgi:hypothetical protein
MVLGEIMARGASLLGGREWASLYTLTNLRERMRDPWTGATVYPKRFVVARFLTLADCALEGPARQQEILGQGASWAEAFARAESSLRAGGRSLVS